MSDNLNDKDRLIEEIKSQRLSLEILVKGRIPDKAVNGSVGQGVAYKQWAEKAAKEAKNQRTFTEKDLERIRHLRQQYSAFL